MKTPPTEADLNKYEDVDANDLPAMYKRSITI